MYELSCQWLFIWYSGRLYGWHKWPKNFVHYLITLKAVRKKFQTFYLKALKQPKHCPQIVIWPKTQSWGSDLKVKTPDLLSSDPNGWTQVKTFLEWMPVFTLKYRSYLSTGVLNKTHAANGTLLLLSNTQVISDHGHYWVRSN